MFVRSMFSLIFWCFAIFVCVGLSTACGFHFFQSDVYFGIWQGSHVFLSLSLFFAVSSVLCSIQFAFTYALWIDLLTEKARSVRRWGK